MVHGNEYGRIDINEDQYILSEFIELWVKLYPEYNKSYTVICCYPGAQIYNKNLKPINYLVLNPLKLTLNELTLTIKEIKEEDIENVRKEIKTN